MTTLVELQATEHRLWLAAQELRKPYEAANDIWLKAYREAKDAEDKEKLRAEIMAELEKEKTA